MTAAGGETNSNPSFVSWEPDRHARTCHAGFRRHPSAHRGREPEDARRPASPRRMCSIARSRWRWSTQSCRLIAFLMMDGARHFSIITTKRKAITAASQRHADRLCARRERAVMAVRMGDFTNVPGGFPIDGRRPGDRRGRRGRRKDRAGCRSGESGAGGAWSVTWIEPTGPARSGRPDDRLREIRERLCDPIPAFASLNPGCDTLNTRVSDPPPARVDGRRESRG